MRPKFKAGDRVVAIHGYDTNLMIRNVKGTVVQHLAHNSGEHAMYAVEFDLCIDGHTFPGGKKLCGWYVPSTHLKKIRQ